MIEEGKWIRREDLDCDPKKFNPKCYYNKAIHPDDDAVPKYGMVEEINNGEDRSQPLTKAERDRIGFSENVRDLYSSSEDLLDLFSNLFG